jgi:hypothetical protein
VREEQAGKVIDRLKTLVQATTEPAEASRDHPGRETMEQKTERNQRVQARYDALVHGKHGHYETMFKIVREEVEAERERCATIALEQRCERGTPWDRACVAISRTISRPSKDDGTKTRSLLKQDLQPSEPDNGPDVLGERKDRE